MSLSEERRISVDGEVDVLPGARTGVGTGRKGEGDVEGNTSYVDDSTSTYYESEDGHDIKFKTLTWKKVGSHLIPYLM
jgi:hypothetical protein